MRAVVLGAIAAAALVGVPGAQPAGTEAVANYCEPYQEVSRDLCYAINRKTTTRTHSFILFMGEPYFSQYRLCVRPPGKKATCREFPVRQMGIYSPRWGGHVDWARNYPKSGAAGPYRVTWLQGGHRLGPPLTFYTRLPSYCSETGDVCYGISRARGAWSLKLVLAAKYFSSYELCVRPVGKAKRCKMFPVKKTGVGGQWGGKVYWTQHFPRAPGRYRVTWSQGGSRIGPPLDFTLPVST